MTDTEQFAQVLAQNFQGVRYDLEKARGTASIPTVGTIEFHEASNDPAVVVRLTSTKRFKGSAGAAVKFVDTLQEAWLDSD